MDSETKETLEELRLTGKRALAFDRFIMRRAWGVYYAVWALAISLFIFLPWIIVPLTPENERWIAFPVAYISVAILATISVSRNFANAQRAIDLRRSLGGDSMVSKRNAYLYFLGWFAVIILMVLLSYDYRSEIEVALFSGLLFGIDVYVYLMLKRHFVNIPVEGKLAVSFFAISTFGGVIGAILTGNSTVYDLAWIPTIVAWLFAAIYTLYTAHEVLVSAN